MKESRNNKRERILNTIEFKGADRMPMSANAIMGIPALEAASGRNDFLDNPKEVYVEAMRNWDVDLIVQFVLPKRLDLKVGPRGEVGDKYLLTSVYPMIKDWKKRYGEFKTPEDVRDFCLSLPDYSKAHNYVDNNLVREQFIATDKWGEFLEPMVWLPFTASAAVGWMWYTTFTYENYLMAHALYPEELERLFKFIGEETNIKNNIIAKTIKQNNMLPLLLAGEDICDNRGPLCNPDILKDIYFPHLKRAVEPIISSGVHFMWHSDGNILPILDDLLDCGIDGFQGFEEDKDFRLESLLGKKCKNGKMPFIHGSVSVTTTMYGSKDDIQRDKRRMNDLFKKNNGGVILSSSSSVMENTPVENIFELFKRID